MLHVLPLFWLERTNQVLHQIGMILFISKNYFHNIFKKAYAHSADLTSIDLTRIISYDKTSQTISIGVELVGQSSSRRRSQSQRRSRSQKSYFQSRSQRHHQPAEMEGRHG
jgi:hypothetical protein